MMTSRQRFRIRSGVATPDIEEIEKNSVQDSPAKGWNVIVWDDPVNTMGYVVHVFRKVLGFDQAKAHFHMMEVHVQGKSCVARENREKAELYWEQLQGYGLKVTLQKSD
jgi:ATP-dependent Clp protease adaptor protein ClpS